MTALSAEEVLKWNDTNATKWRAFFAAHPEALALPCDVREGATVADLLLHIVAAELRYAQRLSEEPVSDYADLHSSNSEEIFALHDLAMQKFNTLFNSMTIDWDTEIDFKTRSAGTLLATRKTILFHALLHSMRHYAQLATLLRHANIPADWQQDYLFMGARWAR